MTNNHHEIFFAKSSEVNDPAFGRGVALCFEGKALPEWVELVPPGPILRGHDGRTWRLDDPHKLVAAFNARALSRPFDINHSTFIKAPRGEDAPAVGWIEELAIRKGRVVGRVAWNADGEQAIRGRKYRYVSPSFHFDAAGNVTEIVGAGLVNTPNFTLPALNSETRPMFEALFKRLGLAEDATEIDAIAAVDRLMSAQNAQGPDPAQFVPRAQYELALNRATAAEAEIASGMDARLTAEAKAVVDQAIKDHKIAASSRDYHLANCSDAAGLASFAAMVNCASVPLPNIGLHRRAHVEGRVALNAEQREVAANMGISEKAFADFLAGQRKGPAALNSEQRDVASLTGLDEHAFAEFLAEQEKPPAGLTPEQQDVAWRMGYDEHAFKEILAGQRQ